MKRIVLILTLSIFIMMTASAETPVETPVTNESLIAKLDLMTQNYANFYFADGPDSTTPITTLALKSNDNTLSGTGSFYIVWDVIYSEAFVLRIYSGAMMTSNKDALHWTLKDGSDKTILDKNNNYGGNSTNTIYTHDPSAAIGNKGSLLLNVATEDVSTLSNSEYSTTLEVDLVVST